MKETWFILRDGPTDPATNMAVDAHLLESATDLGIPTLRFYGWSEPAATFGYFQKISDIESWTQLRPLIRRPTGGGLVPHDADWTYSLAFPRDHWWARSSATDSYKRMHEWIRDAFAEAGLETSLAPCCEPQAPGQCFIGAEKFDLLHGGRKLAGAAQRRNRHGLLIQGSVQPIPPNVERDSWENAMLQCATDQLGIEWSVFERTPKSTSEIESLRSSRFADHAFNYRR